MDGILIIHKATGMTSHDVVARVRKLLQQRRVGHAGTLDPEASGVLPICVGQGTRVAEYLSESGKAYRAEIVLGVVTDTYDREGQVIRTATVPTLSTDQLTEHLQAFLGPQQQVPPRYSAIKLQGQPAYQRARAGEELIMAARPITIERLELLSWSTPRLLLDVECSKGTYIRSLAYDLGEHLGCGAHLGSLIRTRSGPFSLKQSLTLEELAEAVADGTAPKRLVPADQALQAYPAIQLTQAESERVQHGQAFSTPLVLVPEVLVGPLEPPLARVYNHQGHFLAIATWDASQGLWQPRKVFTETLP